MSTSEYDQFANRFPEGEADARRILGKSIGDCTAADFDLIIATLRKEAAEHQLAAAKAEVELRKRGLK